MPIKPSPLGQDGFIRTTEGLPFNPGPDGFFDTDSNGRPPLLKRMLTVTDKDGNEVLIEHPEDLRRILAQMTPEQLERWKVNYRFQSIENNTGNSWYDGQIRDLC